MNNFKNLEQLINHRNSWKETRHSRENKTKVTLILAQQIISFFFFNLLKWVDFIAFPREFHTLGL